MKEKKESLIYQYEDGDGKKFVFLKNSYDTNKKKYLFHADYYDIFKGLDNEMEAISISRVGINKRIGNFK